jgi:phosphoribosylamine--glycine ligase
VLPLLDTDIITITEAINQGTLSTLDIQWKDSYAVCVVMSAKGYPASPVKGDIIVGLEQDQPDTFVFHAGTKKVDGDFVTSGGRVLGITAFDQDLKTAIDKAYGRVKTINFKECHYRNDIGQKAFRHLK